jgi:hypothetical protein
MRSSFAYQRPSHIKHEQTTSENEKHAYDRQVSSSGAKLPKIAAGRKRNPRQNEQTAMKWAQHHQCCSKITQALRKGLLFPFGDQIQGIGLRVPRLRQQERKLQMRADPAMSLRLGDAVKSRGNSTCCPAKLTGTNRGLTSLRRRARRRGSWPRLAAERGVCASSPPFRGNRAT